MSLWDDAHNPRYEIRMGNGRWIGGYAEAYDPRWLVDGCLLKNGLNFLLGAPKARKSSLRRYFTAAILAGHDALGMQTRQVENVLLLVGESAPELEAALQHRVCRALGLKDYAHRIYLEKSQNFVLTDPSDLEQLLDFIRRHNFGLVCIDPLVNFHASNENDAREMGAVCRALLQVAELATVLVIHHSAKPSDNDSFKTVGQRARGSSAIAGAADTSLYLAKQGQSDFGTLSFETRHAKEPEPLELHYDGETGLWRPKTAELRDGLLKERVQAALSAHPGASANEIVTLTRGGRTQILAILKELRGPNGQAPDQS